MVTDCVSKCQGALFQIPSFMVRFRYKFPCIAPASKGTRDPFILMYLPIILLFAFLFSDGSSQVAGMLLFWVTPVGSLETILAQPLWRNSSVNSIDLPGDHQIHLHRYQLSQTIYKARQNRISQPLRIPIWF